MSSSDSSPVTMGMSLIWKSVSAPGSETRPSGSSQASGESTRLEECRCCLLEEKDLRSVGMVVTTEYFPPDILADHRALHSGKIVAVLPSLSLSPLYYVVTADFFF